MSSCKVEFIQGSECSVTGKQITTLVCEYPRAIHSQLLTHKMFSKNSSSTRAVPINTAIEQIRSNPARPIWTENQSGMQGQLIVDPDKIQTIHKVVRLHMENTFSLVKLLGSSTIEGGLNVHKQNAGRYLEPFQNIRIVLTSTEWDNWDWLRNHKDAQPEIEELAKAIYQARLFADSQKKYQILSNGEYHVPFVDRLRDDKGILRYFHPEGYEITAEEAVELSMSICAQTSYRKADTSKDKTDTVIERLFTGVKVHCYDDQTEVLTSTGFKLWKDVSEADLLASIDNVTGMFTGFEAPQSPVKSYYNGPMYHYSGDDIDLMVTPNHNLYAHQINNTKDRQSPLDLQIYPCNLANSPKSKYNTKGESPLKMVKSAQGTLSSTEVILGGVVNDQLALGKLVGMFVGDGCAPTTTKKSKKCTKIIFRFKKQRKISYIKDVLNILKIPFKVQVDAQNIHTFTIASAGIGEVFRNLFYNQDNKKTIPEFFYKLNQDFLTGFFDGLKNSDGSVKRKTWVYSTSSEELKDRLIVLGSLAGKTLTVSNKAKGNYVLNIATKNYVLCNDSRKVTNKVSIVDYSGQIYCASVSGKVLVVRRNGKIVLSGNSSPAEHQATPVGMLPPMGEVSIQAFQQSLPEGVTHYNFQHNEYGSGNFYGWIQQRQLIPNHDGKLKSIK